MSIVETPATGVTQIQYKIVPFNKIQITGVPYWGNAALKKVVGVKWSKADNAWIGPRSLTLLDALQTEFDPAGTGKTQIVAADKATEGWRVGANHLRQYAADLIARPDQEVEDEHAKVFAEELELFPHQTSAIQLIANVNPRVLIADEQGTGKTAVAALAMRLRDENMVRGMCDGPYPALIVCPNTIKTNWAREVAKWHRDLDPALVPEVSVVSGTAAQRAKALAPGKDIYIINYEALHAHSKLTSWGTAALKRCERCGGRDETITEAKCEAHEREIDAIGIRTLIVDEAHRAKNPRTRTARGLAHLAQIAESVVLMTGTPVQEHLDDLWSLLRLLDPDAVGNKTNFLERYARTGFNRWGGFEILGVEPRTEGELRKVTDSVIRRVLKSQVLDLPPLVNATRRVSMSPKQAKAYKEMADDALAWVVADPDDDGESGMLMAPATVAQLTRLTQFANAYCVLEVDPKTGKSRAKLSDPSSKLDAFMDDLTEGDFGDSQLVVFTQSRQLLEILAKRLDAKKITYSRIIGGQTDSQRQDQVDQFQAGKTRLCLVTIAAGGEGLTLTAADTMVFLQREWSSIKMSQAKARCYRIGSERYKQVTIIDYITEDTVEEGQIAALDSKTESIEEILRDRDRVAKLIKR